MGLAALALAIALSLSVSAPTALAHADEGQLGAGVPAAQTLTTDATSATSAKVYAQGRVEDVKAVELVKNKKVKVTWKAVEGAVKYQVKLEGMKKDTHKSVYKDGHWTSVYKEIPERHTVDASSKCRYVFKKEAFFTHSAGVYDEGSRTHGEWDYPLNDEYYDFSKHTFKVRVRYMDADGNWSRWSAAADATVHMPMRGTITGLKSEPYKSGKYHYTKFTLNELKCSKNQEVRYLSCLRFKLNGKYHYDYGSIAYYGSTAHSPDYSTDLYLRVDYGKKAAIAEVSFFGIVYDKEEVFDENGESYKYKHYKYTPRYITKWSEPVKVKIYKQW